MFYNIFFLVLLISKENAVSAFMMENYPRQTVVAYLFAKSAKLSFMLEFKSDIIEDVISTKMTHPFAVVKVLMKPTFFAFSSFFLLLLGSQGCSMFRYTYILEV